VTQFNRMTIVAAAEILIGFKSHADMSLLEVQWDIAGRCSTTSKTARAGDLARITIEEPIEVLTQRGQVPLSRALVEEAILAPDVSKGRPEWTKFVAGLRFDGFEILGGKSGVRSIFDTGPQPEASNPTLSRMLPADVPGTDFREAQSEVEMLLDRHQLVVPKGHLKLALHAFQLGNWSSANAELRNFFEGYLNEFAVRLGYMAAGDAKAKRDFLGDGAQPPFFFTEYNEWHSNNQKPQFIQGMMSRMHPHGSHPGLSEEDDATFRLQITLITARIFLRRFDRRMSGARN
jgi:hypothetical protein